MSTEDMALADITAAIDAEVEKANLNEESVVEETTAEESNDEENLQTEGDSDTDGQTDQSSTDNPEPPAEDDSQAEGDSAEPEMSDDERAARAQGWRPKEEWKGKDGDWVDASEFNRRSPLFEKIGAQNKSIKSLTKKLDALIAHNASIEKKTREKTIAELEAKRKEAVSFGDTEAFDEAEQKLEEVKAAPVIEVEEEPEDTQGESAQLEVPTCVSDFAERHSAWFDKDEVMTRFTVWNVQDLTNKGMPLEQAVLEAEQIVMKTYPDKFKPAKPAKQRKPSAVMSRNSDAPGNARTKSLSDLTAEQRDVWHSLKHTISLSEFLDQIGD